MLTVVSWQTMAKPQHGQTSRLRLRRHVLTSPQQQQTPSTTLSPLYSMPAKGCRLMVVAQNAVSLRLAAQPPSHPAKNEHGANFMHKYLHGGEGDCWPSSLFGSHFWWNRVDPPCRRYTSIPVEIFSAFSAAASSCSHGLTNNKKLCSSCAFLFKIANDRKV